jgi:hypothetical protein
MVYGLNEVNRTVIFKGVFQGTRDRFSAARHEYNNLNNEMSHVKHGCCIVALIFSKVTNQPTVKS